MPDVQIIKGYLPGLIGQVADTMRIWVHAAES
jgi:hypothetical protein